MKKSMTIMARLILIVAVLFAVCCVALADDGNSTAPLFNIDLTPLLQAVLAFLASLITARVIPWIKSKTTAQQQETLRNATRILVYAAEQMHGSGTGQEKHDYVMQKLQEKGLKLDLDVLEATVREMNVSDWFMNHADTDSPADSDNLA